MVALQLSNESLATLYCDKRQQGQFQLSNGNLQIVCFYGTFFNVVVPGNGHSRCSFLWHAMCIRPPLKLGHTEHRAHTLITPIFFYSFNVSWKEFHQQDLNHSYTNLPSPQKILWPRAELWTEKNELQLQLGKLGSNPYYHEMARFSDNNNFSTVETSFSTAELQNS